MPTLTLADLQTRVYARLDQNFFLYPATEVTAAINESIKILNLMTGWLQATVPLGYFSQKNRIWYKVPRGILIPTRITFEGRVLQRWSMAAIGMSEPTFVQNTTKNTMIPVSYWFPVGLDRFAIYPADSRGGGQILVTGIQEPVPLVNPNDTVMFQPTVLSAFDLYAAHILQLKESPKAFTAASSDYQAFQKMVKGLMVWGGFKAPRYFIEELQQPA